jgi:hypothetical protein
MRHLLRTTALVGLLAMGVIACDGDGDDGNDVVVTPISPAPPPPPSGGVRLEDQFGANFGAAFRAAANSDPRDPQPGDLIAVSFTTDPIPVP